MGGYTSEQEKLILNSYEFSGKNSKRAVNLLKEIYGVKVSDSTIRNRWKLAGYEIIKDYSNRRVPKILDLKIDDDEKGEIIRAYRRYEGIPHLAAKSMSYSQDVIKQVWLSAGLTINDVFGRPTIYPKTLESIVKV